MPENASANVGRHLELTDAGRATRARGSSCGRSRPCPSSSTRSPDWPGSCGRRCGGGGSTSSSATTTSSRSPRTKRRIYVGAKLLDPSGELVARYHKMQLVPFGEYVPLQRFFTLGGRFAAKLVQEVSDFTPGDEAVTGRRRRPPRRRLHLLRGDLPVARAPLRRRGGGAAGQHHERRLVRHHVGAPPAPGHGGLPRGREPALPGPRREHRHHRGRRPEGPGPRADAPLRHARSSCARCRSSRRPPSTPATATSSPGPARRWPSPSWPRRSAGRRLRWRGGDTRERRPEAASRTAASEGRGHPRLSLRKPSSAPRPTASRRRWPTPASGATRRRPRRSSSGASASRPTSTC